MKLPSLDDNFFDDVHVPEEKDQIARKQRKQSSPKKEEKTSTRRKSVIPKTRYDDEGKPVLAIPDLDDIDLNSEIDRFFGNKEG